MTRIIISGTNSAIPADAFQQVGRGLASAGRAVPGRNQERKDNRVLEVPTTTSRGGRRPQTTPAAADWSELATWCFLIGSFVAGFLLAGVA